jgi:O-acetyl-ADP-ribose deacetylase (regulator of RNase III)
VPLIIVHEDITKIKMDGVVNAANPQLQPGGGVCGAIFETAGKMLLKDCQAVGSCKTGEAAITFAYKLPARYVVHAVGPVWEGGGKGEPELLRGAYDYALMLAETHDCNTVAFPLISSGIYGYPKDLAFHEAVVTIGGFLGRNREMDVYLSLLPEGYRPPYYPGDLKAGLEAFHRDGAGSALFDRKAPPEGARSGPPLPDFLANLLRVKGWAREELARRANLRTDELAPILEPPGGADPPSKNSLLALALAFGLPGIEALGLLEAAGYSLDPASRTDLTVAFFLEKGIHDAYLVSEASFAYGGDFLGALPRIVHAKGPWRRG